MYLSIYLSFSLYISPCLILVNFNGSDEHGDHPRPLPVIKELKDATDITERKESPSWDYDVSLHLVSEPL